jgi:hypothetical protein
VSAPPLTSPLNDRPLQHGAHFADIDRRSRQDGSTEPFFSIVNRTKPYVSHARHPRHIPSQLTASTGSTRPHDRRTRPFQKNLVGSRTLPGGFVV